MDVVASQRHARAALSAYRAAVQLDGPRLASPDDDEATVDLIVDLLHLAGHDRALDTAALHFHTEHPGGALYVCDECGADAPDGHSSYCSRRATKPSA